MKKIFLFLIIFTFVFSLLPTVLKAQNQESITDTEMLHLMLFVRWGNVIDESTYQEKTVYDGSISLSGQTGKVSLVREMFFEKHNETCDKILTKSPSVSWQSCIYGHWDGVKVLVSGQANDTLTIHTAQGDLTKTVKEFYQTRTPIIQELTNNQEIVVKTFPIKKRSFLLTVFWGGGDKTKIDFSGWLKIKGEAKMKLIKPLRFEERQGDKITGQSQTEITWDSYIFGGRDGLLSRVVLEKEVAEGANLTVAFTSAQVNWQKSFNLIDLFHQRLIKETIPITGINSTKPYTLVLAVKRHPNRKLVKVKEKAKIYMLEDETARSVPSTDILKENNLDLKDVETISEEELETYAEGEKLTYPDGTLVKGSGPAVYFISEGKKRLFKNPGAFRRLGYKWRNVKKVKDKELSEIETGSEITKTSDLVEGSLVQENGKKEIYLIEGGRKKLVSSEVLKARGFDLKKVATVKKELLKKFELGEKLTYPDGTLIKGSGPGVYLMDKGKKRPIKSLEDLKSLKFDLREVKKVKDDELKKLLEDKEVIGE